MKTLLAAALLSLAACSTTPTQVPAGTVLCTNGVWGQAMVGNIQADTVGTRGGGADIKCPAGQITFKDSGDLSPSGQSIRVPVEATPMKLSPKAQ